MNEDNIQKTKSLNNTLCYQNSYLKCNIKFYSKRGNFDTKKYIKQWFNQCREIYYVVLDSEIRIA